MTRSVGQLELQYELSGEGASLIQATGSVKGRGFYFRARHPQWEYEMDDDLGQSPSDVGGNSILFVRGWYSNTTDMSYEEADRIIERCAKMYVELISF